MPLVTWPETLCLIEGEMPRRILEFDWQKTPIGALELWNTSLQAMTLLMLETDFPMCIQWGKDSILIYNDPLIPILGQRHPDTLGKSLSDAFSGVLESSDLPNIINKVYQTGESMLVKDQQLFLNRFGYIEEVYYLIGYSPLLDDQGEIFGTFATLAETQEKVIDNRRLKTLQQLATHIADSRDVKDVCRLTAEALQNSTLDIPFSLFYILDDYGACARLCGLTGIEAKQSASPSIIYLNQISSDGLPSIDKWPLSVATISESQLVNDLEHRFGHLPGGPWPESSREAFIIPLRLQKSSYPTGFLIAGISPRRNFDDKYKEFLHLLANQISATIANVQAYEQERQRAEALAELDQAKTNFFNNVSHEFRTPLTLILGPLEETISELETANSNIQRQRLQIVQRNVLRLLKLVNQLLDYSAVEAKRIQATYQATDLSTFTADIASMFRSAIESGGMALIVECPPLPDLVYVDRDMWEKIVLNLLSNAFKHTFEGQIQVSLEQKETNIILNVKDSGVGIPPDQLPHLFERFYRVPQARSRTHEGSGIGLALVQELVKLHGGSISVQSKVNQGTTFTVMLPTGKDHLPVDRIQEATELQINSQKIQPFINEALGWLPTSETDYSKVTTEEETAWYKSPQGDKIRVLLAEDNADMRNYIERLLAYYCDVESVSDGYAALVAARRNPPDLILSDIMMPKLDGLQLLAILRNDPTFKTIPVVLLSARAGEDARVEGLQMGADDYLVKPFDKRELLARIKANLNLELHRITQQAEEARQISEARFRRLVDSNIIGIFSGRLQDGTITEANDYVLDMLGYTHQELERGELNWRRLTPVEYAQMDESQVAESLLKGYLPPFEKQYFHKDGHRVDILLGAAIMENSRDDFTCYVLDISSQKKAEAQMINYLQRLEQSNQELEEFATIASHDLQEPLRKIMMFSDMLAETILPEGADYLQRLQNAVRRMQNLITDLLNLSRIHRKGQPFKPVDLNQILQVVLDDLQVIQKEVQGQIIIVPLEIVEGDEGQMRQLFQNLIANALKYHQESIPPVIQISGQFIDKDSAYQITVEDNGIGIKPEHYERIFKPFQRLHGVNQYSGTGMGLAICKKIVERHRGTLSVVSQPGKGSQFIITLPRYQKA